MPLRPTNPAIRLQPSKLILVFYFLAIGALTACESPLKIPAPQNLTGTMTTLDIGHPDGATGAWPSATFDRFNRPHISYCDVFRGDLRYATQNAAGQWHITTVASRGAVGKYTAIATNPQGLPRIVFYDQDKKSLNYAWLDTKHAWHIETIAWGLEIGMASQLRFDPAGLPHVFYYTLQGKLMEAKRPQAAALGPAKWHKFVLTHATGSFSVNIDPQWRSDGFWISFVNWTFKDTELLLAHPGPNTSTSRYKIDSVSKKKGPGWRSQLLFEDDKPVIFYSTDLSNDLRLAWQTKQQWKTRLLLNHVGNFRVQGDYPNNYVIAYQHLERSLKAGQSLQLLKHQHGRWQHYIIDAVGPVGEHLAMARDQQGKLLVAYSDRKDHSLKIYQENP